MTCLPPLLSIARDTFSPLAWHSCIIAILSSLLGCTSYHYPGHTDTSYDRSDLLIREVAYEVTVVRSQEIYCEVIAVNGSGDTSEANHEFGFSLIFSKGFQKKTMVGRVTRFAFLWEFLTRVLNQNSS